MMTVHGSVGLTFCLWGFFNGYSVCYDEHISAALTLKRSYCPANCEVSLFKEKFIEDCQID